MGLPASGRRAEIRLIDIMRFDDAGKICEHWGVMDMLTMLQQLGAIPDGPPAPPGKLGRPLGGRGDHGCCRVAGTRRPQRRRTEGDPKPGVALAGRPA